MRGFALPVVLFSISIGAALAVGGAYVTRQLAATATTVTRSADLQALVEELAARHSALDSASRALGVGNTSAGGPVSRNGFTGRWWITRLDSTTWWVVAEGYEGVKPLHYNRLGQIVVDSAGSALPVRSRGRAELP